MGGGLFRVHKQYAGFCCLILPSDNRHMIHKSLNIFPKILPLISVMPLWCKEPYKSTMQALTMHVGLNCNKFYLTLDYCTKIGRRVKIDGGDSILLAIGRGRLNVHLGISLSNFHCSLLQFEWY